MPGSPGTRPTPEPGGRRLALVVANQTYDDPALRRLRSPGRDAEDLHQLLADPRVGAFEVTAILDEPAREVRIAADDFLTDLEPDDLVLVYFSCHGLVDLRRRLYFAVRDTTKARLAATGVEAQWLLDRLEECRARRQVLILDCCFSGAFGATKGPEELGLGERFLGEGRGRVVLTASRGSEYSFEGEPVPGQEVPGSVFTHALVEGIRSGAADADGDGWISVDDAYTYAFDTVRASTAQQTPQRWVYGAEGAIVLARSSPTAPGLPRPRPDARPAPTRSVTTPTRPRPPGLGPGGVPRPALVAAGVVTAVVLGGTVWWTQREPADTGQGPGASFATGSYEADGPWRLQMVGSSSVDEDGCDLELAQADSDNTWSWTNRAGDYQFQIPVAGTFEWTVNDVECRVFTHATPGDAALPRSFDAYNGDTDSFAVDGPVAVEVRRWAEGQQECEVVLKAPGDTSGASGIDIATATRDRPEVTLDPAGRSRAFLAELTCDVRVTAD